MGFDRESRELILETLREYAKRNLDLDYLLELDATHDIPKEKILEMYDPSKLGIHLLLIPQEYGGMGADNYDVYRVCEELARIDLGVATAIFATFLGLDPLRVGGTDEQKEHWMKKVAGESKLVAYCATEPEAGSDLGALTTKAVPVEEDGKIKGYRITGAKQWISNGGIADIYLVLSKVPTGVSWFIVERGTEGLSYGNPEDKHGIRACNTASVFLDEVYVPVENLVGMEEGQGLAQAQAVFGYTRVMVAAFGLGAGWEALRRAIVYSQQRVQSGSPLSEKQGYTHKLIVPHAVKLEASRAYIEEVSRRLDTTDEDLQTEGAIAKYFATNSGNAAAEASIQAHGGYGYTREYAVEKIKRDVRITQIYEGTNEILQITIARSRWQEHLKSRATYFHQLAMKMNSLASREPDVGAEAVELALEALNIILEKCRQHRLTRNQDVLFKIGDLTAEAEIAMVFSGSAAEEDYGEAVKFDRETWQAMARVRAREAALKIALEGIRMVLGAGAGDSETMMEEINIGRILGVQKGGSSDMDLIASKLKSVFKA